MTRTAAIIGGGVIGGGWAARFLLMGWDVRAFDPDPEARRKLDAVLGLARASLPGLHDVLLPPEGRLTLHATVAEAVEGAEWVQESVPEVLAGKHEALRAIQGANPEALVGSSTSGFTPTELQAGAPAPARVLVAHPFNPVYLLPLVEVVPSPVNPPETVDEARATLQGIGMAPVVIGREVPAHVADRLLEAVWREALWLVRDGVATTGEIDEAIRLGFGLRWAQMGLFETYRIAGGERGMRHFLRQFGPALQWPWSRLTDVPPYDEALVDLIAGQSDQQSGHMGVRELERLRDGNLVAILRGLKGRGAAAGLHLLEQDRRLDPLPREFEALDLGAPVATLARAVPVDWTDYNGHVTEARYLEAFGLATDRLLRLLGVEEGYLAATGSFFTAETHLRHLTEARAGDAIGVETRVLGAEGRRLHLWHEMRRGEDLLATGEHLLVHVSLLTRRATAPGEPVASRLSRLARAQAGLPRPSGAGRAVGDPR